MKLLEPKEEWKPIKDYEGLYEVSNLGSVRSCITTASRRKGIMKPYNHNGYKRLNLYKNQKVKKYYVHRLVAEVFIPNPYKYPEVNHIDGNKSNNDISNIEWCTSSQNQIHAYKSGLQKVDGSIHIGNNYRGLKCKVTNLKTGVVIEFNQMKKASKFLGHHKDFISRKIKSKGNPFIIDGFNVKVVMPYVTSKTTTTSSRCN